MIELGFYFILSQIFMFAAMISDFFSFQFKKRQHTVLCFAISASLISVHYFLLSKITAGIIVFFSTVRFITSYFTTKKHYMYGFIVINTIVLIATYTEWFDFIVYAGIVLGIIGTFQENNKLLRVLMMLGTILIISYNAIIFSPMGVLVEGLFLGSNLLGYYRHFIRKKKVKINQHS